MIIFDSHRNNFAVGILLMSTSYTSIYDAILVNKDKEDQEFMEAINSIQAELFTPLLEAFDLKPGEISRIVLYIAYAYSKESKCLVMGTSSSNLKKHIAELVGLPDYLYADVVLLKNEAIRNVILKYLEVQSDRRFRHLMRKRDLYETLCDAQMGNVKNADGNVDYKAISESSKYLDLLLKEIELLEQDYKREYEFEEINGSEIMEVSKQHDVKTLNISRHALVGR